MFWRNFQEKMLRVFKGEPGIGDKIAGRRNWCEIWEASSSISARNQPLPEYQVAAQGSLVFTLRLEVCAALLHLYSTNRHELKTLWLLCLINVISLMPEAALRSLCGWRYVLHFFTSMMCRGLLSVAGFQKCL